jgi:hypothetical protein
MGSGNVSGAVCRWEETGAAPPEMIANEPRQPAVRERSAVNFGGVCGTIGEHAVPQRPK